MDANPAACLFLRLPREAICELRIDDVTPPEMRPALDNLWKEWLRAPPEHRVQPFAWKYQMPDGPRLAVDFSCTRHFRPGRHLAISSFPPAETLNDRVSHAAPPASSVLSKREREVLNLVALGNTGLQIAAQLALSPATVRRHMVNTLAKLGAKNRAHGIAIALQNGELGLDDVSNVLERLERGVGQPRQGADPASIAIPGNDRK